jgi:uncharacterized SAM-binding protein YcdF (DUF218 family)
MFFIFSKVLDFLISPLVWVVFFLLMALRNKDGNRKWLVAATVLLLITTNPFLSNQAVALWEIPAYPYTQIDKPYEVGVLLGGGINMYDEELKRPMYSQSVDRILQTISLYKEGKIKKILVSGGSGLVLNQGFSESDVTKKIFMDAGIPESDIIIENKSRNTHENAVETSRLLKELGIQSAPLLITSAFHMRRSLACFSKAGLKVIPYPTDIKSGSSTLTPDKLIIPDPSCISGWRMLFKEWVGLIAYKMKGYV